jgi:hypothetical protein
MANLTDVFATVSARLGTEEDFTFRKTKEELASAAQSKVAPQISAMLEGEPVAVNIDADGDISLTTERVFVYMTAFGATCSISLVPMALLASNPVFPFSEIIAAVHELRSHFLNPVSYGARIYARFRSPSPSSLQKLQAIFIPPLVSLRSNQPPDFSCTFNHTVGSFRESTEFSANSLEASARLGRDANSNVFKGFVEFWKGADLPVMADKLSPFLDILEAKAPTRVTLDS